MELNGYLQRFDLVFETDFDIKQIIQLPSEKIRII